MATPRKKPVRKVATVKEDEYTALEMHCIKLNEFYKALRKAGFPADIAMTLTTDPDAQPEWFFPKVDITDLLEDEED